jgi:hypothetical protein
MQSPIELVPVSRLKHIEGFSEKRVVWLMNKILSEGIWVKPLALEKTHQLVLDGQHRMEVARRLNLRQVPGVLYDYAKVDVWSLRKNYTFDWKVVVDKALSGEIYPYKTVKHRFPHDLPICCYKIDELMS